MNAKLTRSVSVSLILVAACGRASLPASSKTETPPATQTEVAPDRIPNATITYYDITGSSADELRTELDRFGPIGYDGYKGDATTQWFIRWNWPGYGESSCDLSQATVSYEIEVILPRWSPPDNVQPDLVTQWTAYLHALIEHEKGHVEYVVDRHATVLAAIKNATCESADEAAARALQAIRQHDIEYDAATDHGKSQGARFP